MTSERRVTTQVDGDPMVVDGTVPAATVPSTHRSEVVETTEIKPSGGEMLRRIVMRPMAESPERTAARLDKLHEKERARPQMAVTGRDDALNVVKRFVREQHVRCYS